MKGEKHYEEHAAASFVSERECVQFAYEALAVDAGQPVLVLLRFGSKRECSRLRGKPP